MISQGYAALRKARQKTAPRLCKHCGEALPALCGHRRLYCDRRCKRASEALSNVDKPKPKRTEYNREYQRARRQRLAQRRVDDGREATINAIKEERGLK